MNPLWTLPSRRWTEEVRSETASLHDAEAFRLRWLGRKQGRLKLISDAWLKSAPAEARKPLGMRFNQLKQQIEAALAERGRSAGCVPLRRPAIDITLPGSVRAPGIEHPLLKTMNEIVRSSIILATRPRWGRRWRATSTTSRR